MRTVSTLQTNAAGVALSVLVGLIVGGVASSLVLFLIGLSFENWWYVGFIIPGLLSGGVFFQMGQQDNLPIGYKGVPMFLGERVPGWILTEGTHWLLPGLMSLEPADTQLKTTETIEVQALSVDNVLMSGIGFLSFEVGDASKNLSADKPYESLMKFGGSELRNGISGHQSEELEKPEMKTTLAAELLARMQVKGRMLGYDVKTFDIPEILPPEKIAEAHARLRIEEAEAASESVELKAVRRWIKELGADGVGAELALETMQTERGKAPAQRNIIRIEGMENLTGVLSSIVGGIAGKVADKGDTA